eukprot:13028871-Alexandrium_andersonii.AAC.1
MSACPCAVTYTQTDTHRHTCTHSDSETRSDHSHRGTRSCASGSADLAHFGCPAWRAHFAARLFCQSTSALHHIPSR